MADDLTATLTATLAEIEAHVHAAGWDGTPQLFALVDGTAYEQDALPDGPLDEALAGIEWPAEVDGCALSQEIVILPPEAEAGLSADEIAARAATHPDRREARLVAGVLRDGAAAAVLRVRGADGGTDDVVTGPDLAPNLVDALRATLSSAGRPGPAGA